MDLVAAVEALNLERHFLSRAELAKPYPLELVAITVINQDVLVQEIQELPPRSMA